MRSNEEDAEVNSDEKSLHAIRFLKSQAWEASSSEVRDTKEEGTT